MSIEVGKTLRMIREARSLKLKDVAFSAKISVGFLSLIEDGHREPSLTVLRELACSLRVPVEALILVSQPNDGSFKTTNTSTKRLADSISRLVKTQEALKKELESNDAETS